ncbi:MAG: AraC family transcriptional regulator [Clostridia bacterium]|nr:AraC family transcriptional regulator [Clostridia bacterium]
MNKLFRNKKIVFVWFVSYMFILFISVFVNFIAYLRIESSISLQNSHYVTEILENRKNGIDNMRRLVSNIAMEISHNHEIEDVAISKETKGMAYLNIMEVSRALSVYKNIEGEFNDIYVYFHNSDYCTGLFVCNDAANFYNVHIGNEKMERSRWFELMRSNHTGEFVVEYPKNGTPSVSYMLSVYGSERFIPYATVVIEVDYAKLFPASPIEKYNESFYIVDEQNKIVMSENREQDAAAQLVFDKYGIEEGISAAGDKMIVCAHSENSGWKYVYLMDKEVFRKTINRAREIIIIFNLICIFITTFIAYWLTQRNYKPVRKILNIFGNGDDTKELGFNYIENKVTDIVRENQAYSRITEKLQDNVVKGAFISRLLTEKMSISNKEEILDALGISFAYSNYMVVLFYIEITDEMFFDHRNDNAEEAYRLARLALTNVMNDLITDDKCTVQYCDIEGMLGCIVNMDDKDRVEDFAEAVKILQKMLRESLNIEFMAGLSNVHCSLDMLPECYNEAMSCVEQYFFNANNLVRYSELEDTAVFDCYISETMREQLVAAMQIGNYAACENIINRIFEKNINTGKSVRAVKFILYELAATMIRTITEIGNFENEQNTVSELVGMIENAGVNADAPEIREHILTVIKSFCLHNAQKPVQKTELLSEKAKRYVDENYSNPDLTVAKIAEHCNVSMAYLSTSFKKKYSAGLLEYINYVRIEHAKQILADENCTVERVAEMVGFNNTRSYFRMFSRFVGTSPHKYRTMMLSDRKET